MSHKDIPTDTLQHPVHPCGILVDAYVLGKRQPLYQLSPEHLAVAGMTLVVGEHAASRKKSLAKFSTLPHTSLDMEDGHAQRGICCLGGTHGRCNTHVGIGMRIKCTNEQLGILRVQIVVGIYKGNQFASR